MIAGLLTNESSQQVPCEKVTNCRYLRGGGDDGVITDKLVQEQDEEVDITAIIGVVHLDANISL